MTTSASEPAVEGADGDAGRGLPRPDGAGVPGNGHGTFEAVLDGVLDQWLETEERQGDGQYFGSDLEGDREPFAEAGPYQCQVLVDGVEFVGEGGEVAVAAERVAGEVGELQQEFAGPLRVGADERGDGGE